MKTYKGFAILDTKTDTVVSPLHWKDTDVEKACERENLLASDEQRFVVAKIMWDVKS